MSDSSTPESPPLSDSLKPIDDRDLDVFGGRTLKLLDKSEFPANFCLFSFQ